MNVIALYLFQFIVCDTAFLTYACLVLTSVILLEFESAPSLEEDVLYSL